MSDGIPVMPGDKVVTHDGEEHTISKIEFATFYNRALIYLDNTENFYLVDVSIGTKLSIDSAARYFSKIGNYSICDKNVSSKYSLETVRDKIGVMIQGISSTIQSHLDSDSKDVTIEFLRNLSAEAKGLCEAQEIVVNKLKELNKKEQNEVLTDNVAQEK